MDNALTPKKIQKLINLAEGRSFNIERLLLTEADVKVLAAQVEVEKQSKSPGFCNRYESSSGILDLDQVEGFGESSSNINVSLSKSSTFNPGEMTGRSTGTSEAPTMSSLSIPQMERYGRHSIAIDSITSQMDKQTSEINELMRHSIASNYSFHSKRDLTADEASLIAREAPLPVMQQNTYFGDNVSVNNSNLSVGAYFRNRCMDFGKILTQTESPDKSCMMPSITEVSGDSGAKLTKQEKFQNLFNIDDMLDSVPVRQPRNNDTHVLEKSVASCHSSRAERSNIPVFKQPARPMTVEKLPAKAATSTSRAVQENKLPHQIRPFNMPSSAHKSFMTSSKPTDVLIKNLQSSFKLISEDTEETVENSLSLSKIADYLGKQSNVSVTDMLQRHNRPAPKKSPLTELHMNTQTNEQLSVTKLIDSKKGETGSSAGSMQTVVSLEKLKLQQENEVPEVIITQPTLYLDADFGFEEPLRAVRSKSPSTQSPSTQSTVRDQSSFKSGDSPVCSKDEANRTKVPSPNIAYKELDNSVDWQDVLQQKKLRQRGVVKEQWVAIVANPVDGFVGVTTAVTVSVSTITDSWLTAKFEFDGLPNDGKDLNVELPRLPLLLSPTKTENFTFHITSNVVMNTALPFTFYIKDESMDGEVEQKGEIIVNFKMPVIQATSSDGINKVLYPAIPEKTSITKTFVIISDCPADLQLKLSITEGDSIFCIKGVQEIRKGDVNKVLLERHGFEDSSKSNAKVMNKQLCRLVKDKALRVAITFNSPHLDMKFFGKSGIMTTYNGVLQIGQIGAGAVLSTVNLVGLVGIPRLHVDEPGNKIHVTNEPAKITLSNRGTVAGTWSVRYNADLHEKKIPFDFKPAKFTIAAETSSTIQVIYTGNPDDGLVEIPIFFVEQSTGEKTQLILTSGTDKPKTFPVKSNASTLSWVRAGRKEISLKNNIDRKVHIRCHIAGEGFAIELPGGEARSLYVFTFNPMECRPLPILFTPTSRMPHAATLHMAVEKSNDGISRKVPLFGCVGGDPVRWSGLVTYSETAALVRAASHAPVSLKLHNKSTTPAFVAAHVHFNVQYEQVSPFCRLEGARRVVPGRALHSLALHVDWARLERCARQAHTTTLATVTVLTGAETTRRRILKIIRDESKGKLDTSLIPEHLRVLAEDFDGEDPAIDNFFAEYHETKSALSELIPCGLQELTANVVLPQDFAEEHTIVISDDTVLDHHTLCE